MEQIHDPAITAFDGVFPFWELAKKIYQRPIQAQIETFKEVAEMVNIIQLNSYHLNQMQASTFSIKCEFRAKWRNRTFFELGGNYPHILATLDIDQVFSFITEHIHHLRVGSQAIVVPWQGVTAGEKWIIECAIHPMVKPSEVVRNMWSSYIQIQPVLTEAMSPTDHYFRQVLVDSQSEGPLTFPGLEDALRPFSTHDIEANVGVIREYMRLGATAAQIWVHMWQCHGIQRGVSLTRDEFHVSQALLNAYHFYDERVSDWRGALPIRVRRQLATMGIPGDLLYLIDYVFPKVIIPVGSTIREDEFAWQIQHWIMTLITAPARDPTGRITAELQRLGLDPERHATRGWFRHPSLRPFVYFIEDDADTPRQEDVVLEAYGRPHKVLDYTKWSLDVPAGSSCTICQEEFGTGIDGASSTVKTACGHPFHLDCIDAWMNNSVHVHAVPCPNCRTKICNARPRREVRRYETIMDGFAGV